MIDESWISRLVDCMNTTSIFTLLWRALFDISSPEDGRKYMKPRRCSSEDAKTLRWYMGSRSISGRSSSLRSLK